MPGRWRWPSRSTTWTFRWPTCSCGVPTKSGIEDIKDAAYFGPARVAGKDCDHYAYRQADVDWQVWIQRGKQPLPCKMVITTTQESAQPQYSAVLKWDLAPQFGDATFKFAPPKDAKKIELVPFKPAAKS